MNSQSPNAGAGPLGPERTRLCEVTARDIRHFAQAIGETSPIHFDAEAARRAGHPGIVAPPLFCQTLTFEEAAPDALPPDGSPLELAAPVPAQRVVGGSSEYKIHRLVRAGDVIRVRSRTKDIYTREGKSGLLYMIVVETVFTDQDDRPVAAETATYVKRA